MSTMSAKDFKIDFTGVRRTPEVTYYFFPETYLQAVQDILTNSLITGWEAHPLPEVRLIIPKRVTIPTLTYADGEKMPEKDMAVFISFYVIEDLKPKFDQLTGDMGIAYKLACWEEDEEEMKKNAELEKAWGRDPAPLHIARMVDGMFEPGGYRIE